MIWKKNISNLDTEVLHVKKKILKLYHIKTNTSKNIKFKILYYRLCSVF